MPEATPIERSRAAAETALRESVLPDADIGVIVKDEILVLKGFVCSTADFEKAHRIATTAAQDVAVVNELVVSPDRKKDAVYEAGVESFPASDPPAWMSH